MTEEINVLFNDRDGILSTLKTVNKHIEALVQAAHQLKSSGTSPTIVEPLQQVASHRSPITSSNGDPMDLSVPKGSSFRG